MITKRLAAPLLILAVLATACSSATDATPEVTVTETEDYAPVEQTEAALATPSPVPTQDEPTEEVVHSDAAGHYVEGVDASRADQIELIECQDPSVAAELAEPELRAALRGLIQDHVTRTGELVLTAGQTGLESEETTASYAALDENGLQIGDAVGMVYDDGAADAFVAIWRRHLQLFVDYAVGIATEDVAAEEAADAGLRAYSEDFAAFFFAATAERLPIEPTVETFNGHIDTIETLIRDTLASGSTVAESDEAAHDHVVELSDMLTNAVQGQFPCRFPIT